MLKHSDPDSPSGFRFELTEDDLENRLRQRVLMTGPIAGTISLAYPDVSYDVTEDYIAVRAEDVEALQLAIHRAHHAAGRFLDAGL